MVQISDTVYPMYKAYIEPDLKTAHLKIYNTFNPFSGFMDPTYILKSAQRVSKETIHSLLKVNFHSRCCKLSSLQVCSLSVCHQCTSCWTLQQTQSKLECLVYQTYSQIKCTHCKTVHNLACRVDHLACNVHHPLCSVHHLACSAHPPLCSVHHLACSVHHFCAVSTASMQCPPAGYLMEHAPDRLHFCGFASQPTMVVLMRHNTDPQNALG